MENRKRQPQSDVIGHNYDNEAKIKHQHPKLSPKQWLIFGGIFIMGYYAMK